MIATGIFRNCNSLSYFFIFISLKVKLDGQKKWLVKSSPLVLEQKVWCTLPFSLKASQMQFSLPPALPVGTLPRPQAHALPSALCCLGRTGARSQEPGGHRQVSGSFPVFGGVPDFTEYRGTGKKYEISHPSQMENFRMLENMGTTDG